MNYDVKMKNMILELLKFKQYKRMHLAFKILVAILEFPFILILLLSVGSFYLTYAIFRSISEPIDFINNLIKEEGKEVKHASQFIIYFFGFPVVLIGTIFTSGLTFFIFFEFLFSSIFGEVVSLHGFKFQPFISKTDDDFFYFYFRRKISIVETFNVCYYRWNLFNNSNRIINSMLCRLGWILSSIWSFLITLLYLYIILFSLLFTWI